MSIATDWPRIQEAKEPLRAAIQGKGVAVPSSALINEYPGFVEQISGGGVTPATGFLPNEWNSDGLITKGVWYGNSIPLGAFRNAVTVNSPFIYLVNVDLHDNVNFIGASAFSLCVSLQMKELNNPDLVIQNLAFERCTAFKTFKLRCNTLGQTASSSKSFSICTGLTHVWLSKDIASIVGNNANPPFSGCASSLILYTDASTKPSAWTEFFDNYSATAKLQVVYNTSEEDFNNIVNTYYGEIIYGPSAVQSAPTSPELLQISSAEALSIITGGDT